MICLCCGKPIDESATPEEKKTRWHHRCVKRFFISESFPSIPLDNDALKQVAEQSVEQGFTVTGVQKKLSLHLSRKKSDKNRLTLIGHPAGYILKPQSPDYEYLPEAEDLAMRLAECVGIKTVPFGLVRVGDGDGFAYITRRIDRTPGGEKIAMEDFCQLDLRLTADKYKGSYERCGKIVSRYSSQPMFDITELFLRIVCSFVIGNSDMHLKNFSLIETSAGSGEYRLSEAYDMLPVNIIIPEDEDEMALTLNGKNRHLRRSDFLALADSYRIESKVAERLIGHVASKKEQFLKIIKSSFYHEEGKKALCALIEERILRIAGNS